MAATLTAIAFAFPAAYLVWRNITSDAEPLAILFSDQTLPPLGRTLRLAAAVAASTAVIGTGTAWLTSRTDLPGRRIWRILLPLPLVYPTFVGAAAFIRTLSAGGLADQLLNAIGVGQAVELRGFWGAWLVLTLFTYPYVYLVVAARLRGLSGSLEESARLLGSSPWTTFRRIVLPQTATAILTGTLLVFLYAISDFGAVQLMRYDTLTRAIWTTRLNDQQASFALSLILLMVAALAVIGERVAARRFTSPPPNRGARSRPLPLGRWKVPATTAVVGVVGAALIAPAAALTDWAADGLIRQARGGRPLTIDPIDLVEPTVNTTWASALTAGVAVVAVLPVAYLVARHRSRLGEVAAAVVTSTFALPGLVIALSLFFWTLRFEWASQHLRNTLFLLVFAYLVRFGSQAMGPARVAVSGIPTRMEDAARTLGASRWRRLRTIDVPLMTPGLLAGAGLVLLATMKELPITLLVAPFDFPTLTTRIFQSFEEAFVAEAGLMAMVLVALSGALTWLLVIRRADHLD